MPKQICGAIRTIHASGFASKCSQRLSTMRWPLFKFGLSCYLAGMSLILFTFGKGLLPLAVGLYIFWCLVMWTNWRECVWKSHY